MQEISLDKLMRHYLKYLWVVITATLLGAGGGALYSYSMVKPQFHSDSTVILNQHKNNPDSMLINNYVTLLKSRKVLEPIIEKNALTMNYAELYQNISIVNEKSTEIITISVMASNPELAQTINSSLVESFNLESLGLDTGVAEDGASNQIITVIDEASFSPDTTNVKTTQNVAVMALGTSVAAIIVLFIAFEYQSNRAKNAPAQFARRRSNIIGAVVAPDTETPQATVGEIDDRVGVIKREATDILDVLQNIGGVEITH
ncbi:MAG: hypothetical protein LBT19_02610 [Candidatus Nomurabacteria bacterium]|jgi:capsular polysaccharide biosynthesis protein|nr:hypothetical protein [Candidatus Nomurabacteria bacterium]